HQPIQELIEKERFREDLYFRLKVVEIHVPPLRDRRGDIEAIATALLGRIREETGKDVRRISDAAVERLMAYDWPGNVRELENALLRAAIVARGTVIGEDHLILEGSSQAGPKDLTLEAAIRRHVRLVLGRTDGDESEAVKLLDITPKELKKHLSD
ncbi:MAG: sigma-54-dependent Fis family transcriptional regulator, partial [Gemmatimonadetes bacterium]|nr:sigma-54-dependent Fis family transcriptional regulator [Gemmatimonadota bacterium]